MKRLWIIGAGAMGTALSNAAESSSAEVRTFSRTSTLPAQIDADELWVACKRGALEATLLQWKNLLLQNAYTRLFFIQNGMGLADEVHSVLKDRHWTRVSCWWGARFEGSRLLLTPAPRRMTFAGRCDPDFWQACGLEIEVLGHEHSQPLEWRKALTNLTLNGILALHQLPNGALLEKPELQERARRIHSEARAAAERLGVALPSFDHTWEEVLRTARNTPANRNSLLQDLESCRDWELPWLNEWIIKKAEELKIETPENHRLVQALLVLRANLC